MSMHVSIVTDSQLIGVTRSAARYLVLDDSIGYNLSDMRDEVDLAIKKATDNKDLQAVSGLVSFLNEVKRVWEYAGVDPEDYLDIHVSV